MLTRAYTDALEASLGRVVGDMQRQFQVYVAQSDAVIAQLQARATEAELRFTALEAATERRLIERMDAAAEAVLARHAAQERPDPADVAANIKAMIDGAVAEAVAAQPKAPEIVLPEPPDLSGFATRQELDAVRDAIPVVPEAKDWTEEIEAVRAAIPEPVSPPDLSGFATRDELAEVRAAIPVVPEPKDWTNEIAAVRAAIPDIPEPPAPPDLSGFALRSELPVIPEARDWSGEIAEAKAAAAEAIERVQRHPGRFPVAKMFADGVHYAGDVVTHRGATWQALRDTGREPPHEDWACIAARGEPGEPGTSVQVKGTFNPAEAYRRLDMVMLDGSSWVAKHDDPGPCPGDGWQLAASRGSKGKAADPVKAPPPVPVVAAGVSDDGVLTLTNGDGTTVEADFYPLLAKIAR